MLRLELRDQLGLEAAGLLGVQVTNLLRDVNQRCDGLVVALFGSLLGNTPSTANLNWQLLALGVSDKLAGLLLNVLGSAAGLVDSAALLRSLAVANLFQRLVALLDGFVNSLLLECNLTGLLEVFLAHLLLAGLELCDVCVVALLYIFVGALKDGVLGEGRDGLLLLDTAEPSLWVFNTGAEVDAGGGCGLSILLPSLTWGKSAAAAPAVPVAPQVGAGTGRQNKGQVEGLENRKMKISSVHEPNYVATTKINEIAYKRCTCKRENYGGNDNFSLRKKMPVP